MVRTKRRGERVALPERPPLTLEQLCMGVSYLVTNAASQVADLQRGNTDSARLKQAMHALALARDSIDVVLPLVRKRHREVRNAEVQAARG